MKRVKVISMPHQEARMIAAGAVTVINTEWNSNHIGEIFVHSIGREVDTPLIAEPHIEPRILCAVDVWGVYSLEALRSMELEEDYQPTRKLDSGVTVGEVIRPVESVGPYVWPIKSMRTIPPIICKGAMGAIWEIDI